MRSKNSSCLNFSLYCQHEICLENLGGAQKAIVLYQSCTWFSIQLLFIKVVTIIEL